MMTSLLYIYIMWISSIGFLTADSQISARVGSTVILPCEWRDVHLQIPHVQWNTVSETVFERKGVELYVGDGYQGRVDVPQDKLLKGNCSLVLKNVRLSDAGVYESYLSVRRMKRTSSTKWVLVQWLKLSVDENVHKELPRLFYKFSLICGYISLFSNCVGSQVVSARAGSTAVLLCVFNVTSVTSTIPHIQWLFANETVFERVGSSFYEGVGYEGRVDVPEDELKKGNCSLVLMNVSVYDAGTYSSYLLVRRKAVRSPEWTLIRQCELSVKDDAGRISPVLLMMFLSLLWLLHVTCNTHYSQDVSCIVKY